MRRRFGWLLILAALTMAATVNGCAGGRLERHPLWPLRSSPPGDPSRGVMRGTTPGASLAL